MKTTSDPLSETFGALSDPTRRAILARLSRGEATVGQLAEPFAMSLPAISRHLKVLERAGLITRGREAQWRPCRLDPAAARDVTTFALGAIVAEALRLVDARGGAPQLPEAS